MSDDPLDLAGEDETLQVMYWLRGEGLCPEASPADIVRFTGTSDEAILRVLKRLIERGFVRVSGADARLFALTPEGVREGGRRFADEFADITRPGHGECGDPACECRQTGQAADCRHRA